MSTETPKTADASTEEAATKTTTKSVAEIMSSSTAVDTATKTETATEKSDETAAKEETKEEAPVTPPAEEVKEPEKVETVVEKVTTPAKKQDAAPIAPVVDPAKSAVKQKTSEVSKAAAKAAGVIAVETLFQNYFKFMSQTPILTGESQRQGMVCLGQIVARATASTDVAVFDAILSIFNEHKDDLLSERKALRGCHLLPEETRNKVQMFYAMFINKANGKKISINAKQTVEYLKAPALVAYLTKK